MRSGDDHATCLIVGGGSAGMMLGLLPARAGVKVTVMEKYATFLRDFRGDTVHASTLRLLDGGDRPAPRARAEVRQARRITRHPA